MQITELIINRSERVNEHVAIQRMQVALVRQLHRDVVRAGLNEPSREETPQDSRPEPGRSSPRVWCLRYATCPHPQTRLRTAPYEWRSTHPSRQTDSTDVPPTIRYVRTPHPRDPWHDHPDLPAARRSFPAGPAAARRRMAVCSSATSMRWVTGFKPRS